MASSESPLTPFISKNREWAAQTSAAKPQFHEECSKGQSPALLWLGCSDSRVPETTVLGCGPGDIFVHRNIANLVGNSADLSGAAVIEYAVSALKVKHVVLCGHLGCGGVAAALGGQSVGGVLDTWIAPLRAIRWDLRNELEGKDKNAQIELIVRENVRRGVQRLRRLPSVVREAESRGLTVHGMVYDISHGHVEEIDTQEPGVDQKAFASFFALK